MDDITVSNIDRIVSEIMASNMQDLLNHIIKNLEKYGMLQNENSSEKLNNFISITEKIINNCDDNMILKKDSFIEANIKSDNELLQTIIKSKKTAIIKSILEKINEGM